MWFEQFVTLCQILFDLFRLYGKFTEMAIYTKMRFLWNRTGME